MANSCRVIYTALAAATLLCARAADSFVTIHADHVLFRLAPTTVGANMEDLHYQMVGGFDSQLLHGESFFEHSPTELAPLEEQLEGFLNVNGTWIVSNGVGSVVVHPGDGTPWRTEGLAGGQPPRLVRPASAKEPGARLVTRSSVDAVETQVSLRFTTHDARPASLIANVDSNHSDSGWNWYAGYTVELDPVSNTVRLLTSHRAAQHSLLASAACTIPRDAWIPIALQDAGTQLVVRVAGRNVLSCAVARPLASGHMGLVARGPLQFCDFATVSASGQTNTIALQPNPLLTAPGEALSFRWARLQTGTARGAFAFDPNGWHPGLRSQQIVFESGDGEFGCDNAGLEHVGIALHAGKPYEGFLRVRTTEPTDFSVSLRSADGQRLLAEQALRTAGGPDFQRLEFSLTPTSNDGKGRFAITLKQPGRITVGYVFLQPGPWGRYNGLPIRRDLAEALVAQGIQLLRLNGGMIEVPDFRWKNLHGPRDQRMPYDGFYDRYCSSGYGPVEHLAFCNAAGFTAVIGLNLEEAPDDVADFVAYCNAPRGTPAGDRRAADGHPEPLGLRYYQVGNESGVNTKYVENFKRVAAAVWKVDTNIVLIPCGLTYGFKPDDHEDAVRKRLAPHLELARFIHAAGKPLLWDVHCFNKNDDPAQSYDGHLSGGIELSRWLTKLEPSLGPVPVMIGEFNAARFNFNRGLAHAVELAQAHRAGDIVWGTAMPNVSQPWGVFQSDWKAVLWTQGNIYYTPESVWFQPAYYVQQMIAKAWAPNVVPVESSLPPKTLDVFAAKTEDGSNLVLRVVNLTNAEQSLWWEVRGVELGSSPARVTTLAHHDLMAFNTKAEPSRIRPVLSEWRREGGAMTRKFPPHSFTVLALNIEERNQIP